MTELSDLLAACDAVQRDTHAAASTKQMAGKLKAWAASVPTAPPAPSPAPLTPVPVGALLFSDEFSAPTIDTAKWDVKNRGQFTPSAVSAGGGLLTIIATVDASKPGGWACGEIQGQPTTAYTGPRYSECRAIVPAGFGTWAAPLWERDAPWGALAIENDTCEQLGKEPGSYHVTVHNGPSEAYGLMIGAPTPSTPLSADWHRYGCAMYADHADYYLDGAKVATITQAESGLTAWKFTTTPTVPLVDLDMGGWGGTITVAPPVRLLVDYVKVWALA